MVVNLGGDSIFWILTPLKKEHLFLALQTDWSLHFLGHQIAAADTQSVAFSSLKIIIIVLKSTSLKGHKNQTRGFEALVEAYVVPVQFHLLLPYFHFLPSSLLLFPSLPSFFLFLFLLVIFFFSFYSFDSGLDGSMRGSIDDYCGCSVAASLYSTSSFLDDGENDAGNFIRLADCLTRHPFWLH